MEMTQKLKEILRSKIRTKQFVNRFFPITDFINSGGGLVRCPFHDDSRPSAKIFYDEDAVHLYCYACNKQYGSSDYLELIKGISPSEFLKAQFESNPERINVFSETYVPIVVRRKMCPVKDMIKKHMPEFNGEDLGKVISALYFDRERHEFDKEYEDIGVCRY